MTVKLRHEESTLFPKFKVHVLSPVEAIYHASPQAKGAEGTALLAAILAYLMHSEKQEKAIRSRMDLILYSIMHSARDSLQEWNLSALLCGTEKGILL